MVGVDLPQQPKCIAPALKNTKVISVMPSVEYLSPSMHVSRLLYGGN